MICNVPFLDESEELQHWIRYYFNQGLEYSEILKFLQKYHHTIISKSTLLRQLKDYGLWRRTGKNLSLETIREATERIQSLNEGPASSILCVAFFKDDWFSRTTIHNTDTAERYGP